MIKKNLLTSAAFGGAALACGTLCHRFAPGMGLVLMPMFWPLAVLAYKVPARYSVTTAAVVPFVSCLLTGMPALPLLVAVKFSLFAGVAAYVFRRALARR